LLAFFYVKLVEKMKCIHIDMDCFYAAIEERENPSLVDQPIAVGGASPRSVLCTANYKAREFGCRSAMPVFKAKELCPHLVIVPVRMHLYKQISSEIRDVFRIFTDKIEPLSLDEAYLDVSALATSASTIAKEVRQLIYERTKLTASAGIGPNKMLAKIASDWNKPNGQFEIKPDEVETFMATLPVKNLWGVGTKSLEKLHSLEIKTCQDLHRFNKIELYQLLGNWGTQLYDISRGIDNRTVKTSRISKSLAKETTFSENRTSLPELSTDLVNLLESVSEALRSPKTNQREIKTNLVKLKFADFTQTTVERSSTSLNPELLEELLKEAWSRGKGKSVRLLGAGVKFKLEKENPQLNLFNEETHLE